MEPIHRQAMHCITFYVNKEGITADMADVSMNARLVKTISDDDNAIHGTGILVPSARTDSRYSYQTVSEIRGLTPRSYV